MSELTLTIPLLPPSANHYRGMNRGRYYVGDEAKAFKEAVAIILAGRFVTAKEFEVELTFYLGFGKKGDVANFEKVPMDGLAAAGAFRNLDGVPLSDAHVTKLILSKERDRENPRTEIKVKAR